MDEFFHNFNLLSNRSNRFQATFGQVELLKKLNFPFPQMSASTWLNYCDTLGFKDNIFFEKDPNVFEDQVKRAFHIAETFWRENYRILVLMDGHGRMLYRILRALQTWDIDIDNIQIYVVELDETTHEWHQHFFPCNVTSVKDDIFNLLSSHICADSTNSQKVLPYLNFCGLGNEQIETTWNFIEEWRGKADLIISFSTRGIKKDAHKCSKLTTLSGLVGRLLKLKREGKSNIIAHRDFTPFTTFQVFT